MADDFDHPPLELWTNAEGRQCVRVNGVGYLVGLVEVNEEDRTATVHLYRTSAG